jgi:hypothetical protein
MQEIKRPNPDPELSSENKESQEDSKSFGRQNRQGTVIIQ